MTEIDDTEMDRIYYDLLELDIRDGSVIHIPVPVLVREIGWIGTLRLAGECSRTIPRTPWTFSCPGCGEPSFYAGFCWDCNHYGVDYKDVGRDQVRQRRKQWWKDRIIGSIRRSGTVPDWVWGMRYMASEWGRGEKPTRWNGEQPSADGEQPGTSCRRVNNPAGSSEVQQRAVRIRMDQHQETLEVY